MPSLGDAISDDPAAVVPHRREALRWLAAGTTAALAGCGKPDREIVPYVRMPERQVAGEPVRYATALPLSGWGRGVLVTAVDGRPIKVEGNPRHPASLGATDAFAEAEILELYDPGRSKVVIGAGRPQSRVALDAALRPLLADLDRSKGAGLRVLTGRVASPTLARQVDRLLSRFPGARWHVHEAVGDEAERAGSRLAFGRSLAALPRLAEARTVVSFDADPLGPGPDALRLARGFAAARRPGHAMARLYAVETALSVTGAKADHRAALPPASVRDALVSLANRLGAAIPSPSALPGDADRLLASAARDLGERGGLILAGPTLPSALHALAHWINGRIGAPVDLLELADGVAGHEPGTLADLCRDLDGGGVEFLILLGCNPVFDAPGSLDFVNRLGRARLSLHAGLRRDETGSAATWHVPISHPLESWSDLRAPDGTAAIVQPLIRPLHDTASLHEVLAAVTGEPASGYDLVRETWRPVAGAAFDEWWRQALLDGVVPKTRAAPITEAAAALPVLDLGPPEPPSSGRGLTIVLRPDPSLWDGRYGNNAWLQELPKPLTKQVWGNALHLGARDAERLGIGEGDLVRVAAGGRLVEVACLIEPGHAPGCGLLHFGQGRRAVGPVGDGVGTDVYPLRSTDTPWLLPAATVTPTGRRRAVLTPSAVVRDAREARDSLPVLDLAGLLAGTDRPPAPGPLPSLLPTRPRAVDGSAHAWGMVIDTSACIGCNACVTACQAENNVPVVGPEEIARGRTMHWLRVDVYDPGPPEAPRPAFQPVPCMHCEHAPCEPVCPVAASVHDSEGLNVQVYNRCIGTRFCEANCPYKVRRFNFFGYADGQEYADLGLENYRAGRNPDVTVRSRGVMEKCTYCVQRISRERRAAERDGRPMGTDAVATACQSACPTRAITFGDLHDPAAAVTGLKADARHYGLLAHLGTRPRTTYLAPVANGSPDLKRDGA